MSDKTTLLAAEKAQIFGDIAHQTIYLMGVSFVLGSLFTIFLLLILDFMRRVKIEREGGDPSDAA